LTILTNIEELSNRDLVRVVLEPLITIPRGRRAAGTGVNRITDGRVQET
jgi:hypothetical protein